MKKLEKHLMEAFPLSQKKKGKCSELGIVIPESEEIDSLRGVIKKFFINEGYLVIDKEEHTELAFKKAKKGVYVIILKLDGGFRLFVVKIPIE